MKKKWNIWDILWGIIPVTMIICSSFLSTELTCSEIEVKLKRTRGNHFLVKDQIKEEIEEIIGYPLVSGKLIHNDLKLMENNLKNNKFVKHAQVLSDHKGRITFDIIQNKPIGRVITSDSTYYLNENGGIMPTSLNYSARVIVVLGNRINHLLSNDSIIGLTKTKELINLIKYINQDKFLKAQLASMEVLDNDKILIYPQITKQLIEFGDCGNYVEKLKKLKIFYKQILPRKGWNDYKKVNLEYRNQIVCE